MFEAIAASVVLLKTLIQKRAMEKGTSSNKNNTVKPEFSENLEYPYQYEEKVCRICAEYGDVYIFNELSGSTIADYINTYSKLNISPSDVFPKWVCEQCLELVKNIIKFDELCRSSRDKLVQYKLKHSKESSEEFIEYGNTSTTKREQENFSINIVEMTIKNDVDDPFADDGCSPPSLSSPQPAAVVENEAEQWEASSRPTRIPTLEEYRRRLFPRNERLVRPKRLKTYLLQRRPIKKEKRLDSGSHLCEVCGKSMANPNSLIAHRTTHLNVFPFKCDKCPYRGRTKDLLKVHSRTHLPVRPFACPQCPLRFLTASNLGRHKKQHEDKNPEQCQKCGKNFANKTSLNRHMTDIHTDSPPAVCDICGRRYSRQNNMHKHRLKAHNIKLHRPGRWPAYLLCQENETTEEMEQ